MFTISISLLLCAVLVLRGVGKTLSRMLLDSYPVPIQGQMFRANAILTHDPKNNDHRLMIPDDLPKVAHISEV
jgi:hypothetical protein